jgi:glycosyltransferase A (GT-A) superfamily protein (DUF2064 family)
MNCQLLVITKAPRPGWGKTRLSPPCNQQQAAEIAAAAVADTLDTVRATPAVRRVVALDGTPDGLDLTGCDVVLQATGSLGTRLATAFSDAMAAHPVPTLLIGMDTPQVTPDLLTRCLGELLAAGPGAAVLGTAPDGGWWALGLHRAASAEVLETVPMSRPDTGARTRGALEQTGLGVLGLPELADIDHFPDAVVVAAECPPHSRTRRVVSRIADVLEQTP